jgi:hypothetical protein
MNTLHQTKTFVVFGVRGSETRRFEIYAFSFMKAMNIFRRKFSGWKIDIMKSALHDARFCNCI